MEQSSSLIRTYMYMYIRTVWRNPRRIYCTSVMIFGMWLVRIHTIGVEAKRVFDDAQKLLRTILSQRLLRGSAVLAFYPAHASGDDITLRLSTETGDSSTETVVLHGLRQQVSRMAAS